MKIQTGSVVLRMGVAEVDITPPIGAAMMGSLRPRKSIGIQDPLYAKAIVLQSGTTRLAYVLLDICMLARREGDAAVRRAARKTGIPEDHIVWAANHTHTGPYTVEFSRCKGAIPRAWLAQLPGKFAAAVAQAAADLQPVRVSRCRAFQNELIHHRRLMFKNGQAVNTWNLGRAHDVQAVGSAGPVDPEIPILSFESPSGEVRAVMYQYALHTNTNFGLYFSADYPAVVAARLREQFGKQVVSLFVPGACGNINSSGPRHRQVGNAVADAILGAWPQRVPIKNPGTLRAMKRNVVVPLRDPTPDQESRIRDSGWDDDCQEFFREEWRAMRKERRRTATSLVQAWRIGEIGFVSMPGELFVEWGLKIKRASPFPWTYPVELGGDYLGYLITPEAWQAGGYEALISRVARPSVAGVARLADTALDMLKELHKKGNQR